MRRLLTILVFLLASGLVCGTANAEKPKWWPTGFEWPPKAPGEWPTGKVYPPEGKDIHWWIKHFRARSHKPGGTNGNPKDPKKDKNRAGHRDFANGFPGIEYRISGLPGAKPNDKKPDCGFFQLSQAEVDWVKSCEPFPAKIIKDNCIEALNVKSAEAVCKEKCGRDKLKLCKKHRLYKPEIYSSWGCIESAVDITENIAVCRVDFICECKK